MSGALLNATQASALAVDLDAGGASTSQAAIQLFDSTTAITFLGISTRAWTTVLAVYLAVVFVFIIAMTLCCLFCGCFEENAPRPATDSRPPTSIVVIPQNPAPINPPPPSRATPPSDVVIEEKETVTRLPDGSVCTERTTIKSHSSERRHKAPKKKASALTTATERSARLRRASQRSRQRSSRGRRTKPASTRSVRSNRHVSFADEHLGSALESNTGTNQGEYSP